MRCWYSRLLPALQLVDVSLDNVQSNGVKVFTETKANELLVEDGRVIGVEAVNTAGDIITYKAAKGGIYGSNRLGGNVITAIMVFGRIAGTNASK